MSTHRLNRTARDLAVELSLDAAIEVDEAIRGIGRRAPALKSLANTLLGVNKSGSTQSRKDLLSDSRVANLYRRASTLGDVIPMDRLNDVLDLFIRIEASGLANFSDEDLRYIRDFCLGLNRELVSEAYGRTPNPSQNRTNHQETVWKHES